MIRARFRCERRLSRVLIARYRTVAVATASSIDAIRDLQGTWAEGSCDARFDVNVLDTLYTLLNIYKVIQSFSFSSSSDPSWP